MKVGRIAVALVTLVGFSASTMGTAHAWFGNSHRELARQAILWMLRSSNPHQRLAGAVIVSAGEGYRANAIGKRNWILSQEAKAVDYYRDLALRNEGDTPSEIIPKVSYDFQGEVYTKFNHLLLAGRCDVLLPDGSGGCPEGMQLDLDRQLHRAKLLSEHEEDEKERFQRDAENVAGETWRKRLTQAAADHGALAKKYKDSIPELQSRRQALVDKIFKQKDGTSE